MFWPCKLSVCCAGRWSELLGGGLLIYLLGRCRIGGSLLGHLRTELRKVLLWLLYGSLRCLRLDHGNAEHVILAVPFPVVLTGSRLEGDAE